MIYEYCSFSSGDLANGLVSKLAISGQRGLPDGTFCRTAGQRRPGRRRAQRRRRAAGICRPGHRAAAGDHRSSAARQRAGPHAPANDTIGRLVDRAAASGLAVTVDGELEALPSMADRAAHRLVQEALTNAAKHAPGAAVTVRLATDTEAEEAVVSVRNEPPPDGSTAGTAAGGGHGLVGLDERIRLAGGRLRARSNRTRTGSSSNCRSSHPANRACARWRGRSVCRPAPSSPLPPRTNVRPSDGDRGRPNGREPMRPL
jgi:hypothetical protein